MKPGAEADRVLLAHMRECVDRIGKYNHFESAGFDTSRLVQEAVIRNLQTLADPASACRPRSRAQSRRLLGENAPGLAT